MILRCLVSFFFIFSSLGAIDIHAILVIDRDADEIHRAMALNQIRWEQELKKISRFTQIQVNRSVHHDLSFLDTLAPLEVKPDDVILFYWCCHGFRPSSKDPKLNPWPNMLFEVDPQVTIDFDEVVRYLETKGARLLIAVAETCNHQIPFFLAPPTLEFYPKGKGEMTLLERYQRNCHTLFAQPRGIIKIASSHPGQYSYAKSGSVFTSCFLEILKNELYQGSSLTWESLLDKATSLVFQVNGHQDQEPYFDLRLLFP